MKFHAWPLVLAFGALTSSAVKIPFRQAKRSLPLNLQRRSGGAAVSVSRPGAYLANSNVLAAAAASGGGDDSANALDINSVHDLIYLANITLGGQDYPVQLDTGSSDLWVKGPSSPLPNVNQTTQTYNITYGIGWAFGHVSYATAQFAGINVASQAFMDVSDAQNPALGYGASGILGLGFTSLSTIDALVNMTNAPTGRSLLYNLFADNPKEPNFIAFSLERTTDKSDDIDGSFSVGEYDPKYKSVADTAPIPTFPENSPSRWSILVDSIIVGEKQIAVKTSVATAPGNKAVALLDSGTSYSYAPPEVCDAIYSGVNGAKYDSGLGQWVVPCDAEIDMAIQINNEVYPIHPLDVSPISLGDSSTCVGSWVPQAVTVGKGEFDWLVGDNFLRSVYSIYDFGDFDDSGNMGNPYMKLLSLVDPNEASKDFHSIRGGTARNNITYNASNSSSSTTTISLSDDVAQVLDKIGKFFPAMLAIMAFNALILMVLVIVGIILLCKKRRGSVSRKTRGRMSPVPLNRTTRFSTNTPEPHQYQPVSMALTEDTFVPPMPAFRGDSYKSRPKSTQSLVSLASTPPPEDPPFTPPTPSFRSNVRPGDRPQSSFVPSPTRRQSVMPLGDRPQSAYSPSADSPRSPAFATPLSSTTFVANEQEDIRPRSSSPPSAISPEDSLFEPPHSSRSSIQAGVRRGSYNASQQSLSPQAAAFRSNVQPGDRPSSYAPRTASPEDDLFAPPVAAFRGSDRPQSYA